MPEEKSTQLPATCEHQCGAKRPTLLLWYIIGAIILSTIIFSVGYKVGQMSLFFPRGFTTGGFCPGPNQELIEQLQKLNEGREKNNQNLLPITDTTNTPAGTNAQ